MPFSRRASWDLRDISRRCTDVLDRQCGSGVSGDSPFLHVATLEFVAGADQMRWPLSLLHAAQRGMFAKTAIAAEVLDELDGLRGDHC